MKKIISVFSMLFMLITVSASLTGCSAPPNIPNTGIIPEKLTIPWGDYTEAKYSNTVDGKPADDVTYLIEKTVTDGKQCFKFNKLINQKGSKYESGAVVSIPELKPVSSYIKNLPINNLNSKSVDIIATYKDKLVIDSNVDSKKTTTTVALPEQYIDNESFPLFLSAFSLKENFLTKINLCIITVSKVSIFSIKVVGKEKIKVPYGEAACYKVEFSYTKSKEAPMNLWYSADDKKILMKYGQTNNFAELKSIKYQK
jgi:hypothetical protein